MHAVSSSLECELWSPPSYVAVTGTSKLIIAWCPDTPHAWPKAIASHFMGIFTRCIFSLYLLWVTQTLSFLKEESNQRIFTAL